MADPFEDISKELAAIEDLEESVAELEEAVGEHCDIIDEFMENFNEVNPAIDDLQTQLEDQAQEIAVLDARVEELETTIKALVGQLTARGYFV